MPHESGHISGSIYSRIDEKGQLQIFDKDTGKELKDAKLVSRQRTINGKIPSQFQAQEVIRSIVSRINQKLKNPNFWKGGYLPREEGYMVLNSRTNPPWTISNVRKQMKLPSFRVGQQTLIEYNTMNSTSYYKSSVYYPYGKVALAFKNAQGNISPLPGIFVKIKRNQFTDRIYLPDSILPENFYPNLGEDNQLQLYVDFHDREKRQINGFWSETYNETGKIGQPYFDGGFVSTQDRTAAAAKINYERDTNPNKYGFNQQRYNQYFINLGDRRNKSTGVTYNYHQESVIFYFQLPPSIERTIGGEKYDFYQIGSFSQVNERNTLTLYDFSRDKFLVPDERDRGTFAKLGSYTKSSFLINSSYTVSNEQTKDGTFWITAAIGEPFQPEGINPNSKRQNKIVELPKTKTFSSSYRPLQYYVFRQRQEVRDRLISYFKKVLGVKAIYQLESPNKYPSRLSPNENFLYRDITALANAIVRCKSFYDKDEKIYYNLQDAETFNEAIRGRKNEWLFNPPSQLNY